MKTIRTLFGLLVLLCIGNQRSFTQCRSGYSQVTLNWDNLDFLVYSGTYDNGYLSSNTQAYTQHFAFGTNRLSIQSSAGLSLMGENDEHTAQPGDDVEFFAVGDNSIVITFEQEVYNLRFSLYDIDFGMRVNVSAVNSTGDAVVTLSKGTSSSGISLVNNPGTNPQARGFASFYGNNDARGTVNVNVADAVKTITLTFDNSINEFWLSDITACSPGSFPNNYYAVSRPFTNQPAYVLESINNSVYAVNPANGNTRFIFADASIPSGGEINSMAYDPYKHILYYVPSNMPGVNKMLKKYDVGTGVISTVLNDITSIGVPVSSDYGVELGGAAFYNGSLYLGIEAGTPNQRSGRESMIWRIDFNASNVPLRASQVFARPVDNGSGTLLHDWADFVINDGVLYNFNGANNHTDIYEVNLISGGATVYDNPGFTPVEAAVDWNGNIYQLQNYIARYNDGALVTNTRSNISTSLASPRFADAAEAFRPASDFGDAPSSYSPNAQATATHEVDPNLRLGSTFDSEWDYNNNGDGADEDAIGSPPALNFGGRFTYTINNISVYNNTGASATLIGWLDYNFNGTFEPGEGISIVVPSKSTQQLVTLAWPNINVPASTNLRTFLRLRVTSTSNGMTNLNPNGWYNNGEVEDYPVVLGVVLAKEDALVVSDTAMISTAQVFPNPATNYAIVKCTATNTSDAVVQLLNSTGQLIINYQQKLIAGENAIRLNDLSALPKGVYTVRIGMSNKVIVSKLVIGR